MVCSAKSMVVATFVLVAAGQSYAEPSDERILCRQKSLLVINET
jgi:hypothetical protein